MKADPKPKPSISEVICARCGKVIVTGAKYVPNLGYFHSGCWTKGYTK